MGCLEKIAPAAGGPLAPRREADGVRPPRWGRTPGDKITRLRCRVWAHLGGSVGTRPSSSSPPSSAGLSRVTPPGACWPPAARTVRSPRWRAAHPPSRRVLGAAGPACRLVGPAYQEAGVRRAVPLRVVPVLPWRRAARLREGGRDSRLQSRWLAWPHPAASRDPRRMRPRLARASRDVIGKREGGLPSSGCQAGQAFRPPGAPGQQAETVSWVSGTRLGLGSSPFNRPLLLQAVCQCASSNRAPSGAGQARDAAWEPQVPPRQVLMRTPSIRGTRGNRFRQRVRRLGVAPPDLSRVCAARPLEGGRASPRRRKALCFNELECTLVVRCCASRSKPSGRPKETRQREGTRWRGVRRRQASCPEQWAGRRAMKSRERHEHSRATCRRAGTLPARAVH